MLEQFVHLAACRMRIILLIYLCFLWVPTAYSSYCSQENCTCLESELESALKNDIPWNAGHGGKYSNAHNISRALYPSTKAPAKFVLVKVKYKTANNNMTIENYIWTLSCIYGILPHDLLAAVSLGTLYHEREVLELTVPEFCQGVPGREYMEYALFSLQDIAIIPISSDPRLNTAECVFKVNDNSDVSINQVYFDRNINDVISTFHLLVSLFGGSIIGCILKLWYDEAKKNVGECAKARDKLNAFKDTVIMMILLEFIVSCVVFVLVSHLKKKTGFAVYFLLVILGAYCIIILIMFVLTLIKGDVFSSYYFFPLCCAVCYHVLWILLGIFAHPSWAFSILLPICSFVLLLYLLAYYRNKVQNFLTGYIIIVSAFLFFVAFTWISVRFYLADKLISSLIQTLFMAFLGGLFSLVSYFKPAIPDRKGNVENVSMV